jgi:hypothetical protein
MRASAEFVVEIETESDPSAYHDVSKYQVCRLRGDAINRSRGALVIANDGANPDRGFENVGKFPLS